MCLLILPVFIVVGFYASHTREAAMSLLIDPKQYKKLMWRPFIWAFYRSYFEVSSKQYRIKGFVAELLIFILFIAFVACT